MRAARFGGKSHQEQTMTPLAGYKTYIAAALAIAGALCGALDGEMSWQQAAALIVPSIIGAALRHGISTAGAALLRSVLQALAQAADQAGKKAIAVLVAASIAGVLAACSAQQAATADRLSASECEVLAWGEPLILELQASGRLDPNGQDVLKEVHDVLSAGCRNGDQTALARVPDLAKALVAILFAAPAKAA
jgi:hypothetical protein